MSLTCGRTRNCGMLRLLCASFTLLGACAEARVQPAYFSLQGELSAPGDQHDFNFTLTRSVGSAEDLRFVGYSQVGGTNTAGDVVVASNLDTLLALYDSASVLHGQDSDSGLPDALLSWPGASPAAFPPLNPDPLPAGEYRLNLSAGAGGLPAAAYSVDLIGPADALVYTGDTAVNLSVLDSIKFGAGAIYQLSGDLTITGTLESQWAGVIAGDGADGTGTSDGSPGRTIASSHAILSSAGSVWNLSGGSGTTVRDAGPGGAIVINGGTAMLAGDTNLRGGAHIQGASSSVSGGAGGSISLADSDVTIFGAVDLDAGRYSPGGSVNVASGFAALSGNFTQRGGVGAQQQVAGPGGTLSISGGEAVYSGEFELIGGAGGDALTNGGDAGSGGSLTVSGGVANLTGTMHLTGGRGGDANNGSGGGGGRGGSISITGGLAILTGAIGLDGGDGGTASSGSFGGEGGSTSITAGELFLDGGSISLAGGSKNGGTGGGVGANGSVSISGGTLTLDTGTILGRGGAASADPLTIANAGLNISGGVVIANNAITVSGSEAVIELSGGSFTGTTVREAAGGDLNLSGGGVLAVDTFDGTLDQSGGRLVIGSSPGVTHITGAYNLSGGVLEIELFGGGASPVAGVDFDQLTADNVSLGGEIEVLLDPGYAPTLGDRFSFLTTTGGVSGMFAAETLPTLAGGLGLEVRYQNNEVSLLVTSNLPGDYNNDGVVDAADYTVWRDNEGQAAGTLVNDADGGVIGMAQYNTWVANFGDVITASVAIPEPGTLALMVAGLFLSGRRRSLR